MPINYFTEWEHASDHVNDHKGLDNIKSNRINFKGSHEFETA